MHFWIDKRSQQCGFGRSRVAASLSGAGGSGMGLSFGHPPRRIGGSNKTHSRNTQAEFPHSSNNGSSTSRTNNHSLYQQHVNNNNNFSNGNNCQHAYNNANASSSIGGNGSISGSSGTSTHIAATAATIAIPANATQSNLNNNPHQQYTGHNNHITSSCSSNHTNSINNNNSISAILTGTGTVVPATHSYNPRALNTAAATQSHQMGNHHYDLRSYHHPQFGNMSLRHYQHVPRNCSTVHANVAASMPHYSYRSASVGGNSAQSTNVVMEGAPQFGATTQHDHWQYRHHSQTINNSAISTANTGENTTFVGGPAQSEPPTNYAIANVAPRYSSVGNIRNTHMTDPGQEVQMLPSHLKCGMCASLFLASLFVAGAKFYFDHQGTGLEVLIFCAFSATLFLAACTVSMCRVPKGLLPGARPTVVLGEHQRIRSIGTHCAVARGTGRAGGYATVQDNPEAECYNQHAQLIEESTAGPPPYHIAIFLPETDSSSKAKDAPADDESPPPSYDKILI